MAEPEVSSEPEVSCEPEVSSESDVSSESEVDAQRVSPERLAAAASSPNSSRWARVGGAASLVYVVWYLGDVLLFRENPRGFNAAHRFYDSFGMRAVFGFVLLMMMFHALNGLRLVLCDLSPSLARRDLALRVLMRFVCFAAWVPAALALLWPAIRVWIAG